MQAPVNQAAPKKPAAPQAPVPPPRNPPPALARLLQQTPAVPPQELDAYEAPVTEQKGGLPLEIVSYAQKVYNKPHIEGDKNTDQNKQLQPGWGGKGTI